jgi:predicted nucleotidyltransferase
MTTLIKNGMYQLLYIFYTNQGKRIHLRELSRMTEMYGQSISRYLQELEKKHILKSEKEGNLKQYFLMHNQETYIFLAMFDIEKYNKLPLLRKQAISTYLHSLPYPPVFAVLFGSTAKETYKENSDIDILIITPTKIDAHKAEKEVDALHAVKISTFQMTFQNFIKELKLKEDPVVQSAINTGYPLVNHVSYYEVLHNERV